MGRGGRRLGAFGAALLGLLAPGAAAPAAEPTDETQAAPTMAEMRKRDRFANPARELEAWRSFAQRIFADPASAAALRAETQMRLAIAYFYATSYPEGWSAMEAAMRLVEADRLEGEEWVSELYAYASLLSTDLGQLDRAKRHGETALRLAQGKFGDDSAEAGLAYNSLAYHAFAVGNLAQAKEWMCGAADRARRHLPPTDTMVSSNLISCGVGHYYLDDDDTADVMREAATFAYSHLPPDHPMLALALNSSGGLLLAVGRYAEAEEVIRRELDLSRKLLGDHPDRYSPLSNLARALSMQGKYEEAEAVLREALSVAERMKQGSDPGIPGQALVNIGGLYERMGRDSEALAYYRRGYERLVRDLAPGHSDIGNAGLAMARLLARGGQVDEALALAAAGRANLSSLPETHKSRLGGEIAFAAILARAGRNEEAYEIGRKAAAAMEARLLDLAASRAELVSLSSIMVEGFSEFAYMALRASHPDEAVRAAQLASLSELSLVNSELAARNAARDNGAGALIDRLRAQRSAAGRLRRELARIEAGEAGDAAGISRRLGESDAAVRLLSEEVEREYPDYRRLGRPAPADLAAIRAHLRPDQALILPLNLSDRAVTLAVTHSGIVWRETAGGKSEIAGLVERIRGSVEAFRLSGDPKSAPFDSEAAHGLYRLIFPDGLEQALGTQGEFLFPASGPIASIPPSLLLRKLPAPGVGLAQADWLIRTRAVEIVSDFAAHADRPGAGTGFVGLGSPSLAAPASSPIDFSGLFRGGAVDLQSLRALPSLPFAKDELKSMQAAFGRGRSALITGDDFTESKVRAFDFAPYSVAAFATHGLTGGMMNGLHEPALVFTPPDRASEGDDGLLTATEIAQLSIEVDWVILSACNSGGGLNSSAPTYSGLARAFRLAGARSLLLSHWQVRDDAATRLTTGTVKGAASGLSRAAALRLATLALMADKRVPGGSHPAIWAPFILIGD